ncbi:MAG: DNA polymerase/3'-5' exonuclease PolX [Candidatus Omnitrophica bacterium]|nr:DNA polymerase/3'-5' exonuclease PolX [Candidatus Omnitrophota bacterium]MBU1870475.1 DNA polymerase/3'-5' exonuclease PolX [Candidatus Omnitrophota bacterium]
MINQEIAQIFRNIAEILEIKGDNPFRIRAYERAAQNIDSLTEDIANYIKEGRLFIIPGIGKDLAQKIQEYVATGKLKFYSDLKKSIPEGMLELLKIPSVGPKTAKLLLDKLKIRNLDDLGQAIKKGRLKGLAGIKEKTISNIIKGIELVKRGKERMNLAQAGFVAEEFISSLKNLPEVKKIGAAGSLRRQKETVRDIDILVISDKPKKVMGVFANIPSVREVLAAGETKSSVRTKDDVQVDCRVVEQRSFGAALLYFTGSKDFNIKIRQIAIKKGLKINEYGVFRKGKFLCGKTEEEIFKALGMDFVEPELRENTGEIELAQKSKLPRLISIKDIKADLHAHSDWSDGSNSIEEMAQAAKKLGYSYIAITDHSQSLKVAGGVSVSDLKKKKKEIEGLNKTMKGFRILYGTEVDIDSAGNLDYKDDILSQFDLVVAAIHTGFRQSKEQLTRRIKNACKNKYVHIIAHPTGRLWGARDAYDIDFEEVFKAARETNTAFEINAFPNRLDLNDHNARRAKEMGVRIAIGTDSHEASQLAMMKLGVATARRGWLGPEDVLNTLSVTQLLKAIKKS